MDSRKISHSSQEASSSPTFKLLNILSSRKTTKSAADYIECEIIPSLLYASPEYETLSYTWGSSKRDCPVHIHTTSNLPVKESCSTSSSPRRTTEIIYVTNHLHAALINLRCASQDRLVWIDQLCINQSDIEERNTQVALMADIYRNAHRTVIWLGSGNMLPKDEAFITDVADRMEYRPGVRESSSIHDQDLLKKLIGFGKGDHYSTDGIRRRKALAELLNQSWFTRAWVFQEAVVSKTSYVICGGLEMDFDIFINLLDGVCTLDHREVGLNRSILKHSTGHESVFAMRERRFEQRYAVTFSDKNVLLSVLWQAQRNFQATDPCDKIYAFLAFQDAVSHEKIQPCYEKSVAFIYADTAARIIRQTGRLYVFELSLKDEQSLDGLPSWVPDFSKKLPSLPFIPHDVVNSRFDTSKDMRHCWKTTHDDWRSLWVQGRIIDKVCSISNIEFENDDASELLNKYLRLSDFIQWIHVKSKLLYATTDHPEQKLLRTLLADGAKGHGQLQSLDYDPKETLEVYHNEDTILKAKKGGLSQYPTNSSDSQSLKKLKRQLHYLEYVQDIAQICRNKRFFLSNRFYFGLAFREIRAGDLICILHGCKTPSILRETAPGNESSQYRFVAQAYLDGWMQGISPEGRTLEDYEIKHLELI